MSDTNINYCWLLEYLSNNMDIPYERPNKPGLSKREIRKYEEIKDNGQKARAELDRIAQKIKDKYGLDDLTKTNWLSGGYDRTRKYLWEQMKYEKFKDSPVSISIFVESEKGEVQYRISLEIKNTHEDTKEWMDSYHAHLDIPKKDNMVYVEGSNENGNLNLLTESVDEIKNKIASNEYKKVQLSVIVEAKKEKTNEEYEDEIIKAVEKILPYYEHVTEMKIGRDNNGTKQRAYLLTYNPIKNKWTDYSDKCEKTASGQVVEDSWACKSKKPSIGDEVFLIKLGDENRGIMGHGIVSGESHKEPHYEIEKANQGKEMDCINVKFDRILNYNEARIPLEKLKEELPDQAWNPEGSGIEIKAEVLPELRRMWNDLVNGKGENSVMNSGKINKNTILCGPPGTGKTYNTVKYAVAICEGKKFSEVEGENYDEVKDRYEKLKKDKRIAFVTFHQSYGYEDFIEGIKPEVDSESKGIKYDVTPGLFKSFCEEPSEYKVSYEDEDYSNSKIWSIMLNGREPADINEIKKDCFNNDYIRFGLDDADDDLTEKPGRSDGQSLKVWRLKNEIKKGDLVVVQRGKMEIDAVGIITGDYEILEDKDIYKRKRDVKWIFKDEVFDISDIYSKSQISPNYLIKMDIESESLLKKLKKEDCDVTKIVSPRVFIIDEINRGNISKIFGELITLVEETKRKGEKEETFVKLPYSGDEFSIPSNIYILGTMNTADRSIALIDTALRRRFSFLEMIPKPSELKDIDDVKNINIEKLLATINRRIEVMYDREHTIGHAFFMEIKNGENEDERFKILASIFKNKIVPLLQEYFYEDYEKIQYVLGDNDKSGDETKFIIDKQPGDDCFKGSIEYDMPEKIYSINNDAFENEKSYIEIY